MDMLLIILVPFIVDLVQLLDRSDFGEPQLVLSEAYLVLEPLEALAQAVALGLEVALLAVDFVPV